MEAVGTFFLVLIIALTGNPLAIGLGLAMLVYMGAHVSGAQYNPAVSLGLFIIGKLKSEELFKYVLSQMSGAFVACILASIISGKPFVVAPDANVFMAIPYLAEALFTFLLVSVVFHVAVDEKAKGNSYFGLAIGLAVLAGAFAVGSISGGAFNPAVGVAPVLVDPANITSNASKLLLYTVGPCIGSVAAAIFYKMKA